jgi:ribosomal protein L11 methyltransferase
VLKILAKSILNNVKENGYLIMSGIIHSRYDEVLETYKELGFELLEKRVKGEWIAMAMKKVK